MLVQVYVFLIILFVSFANSEHRSAVVITGATGALGRALCSTFAGAGDKIYAGCRDVSSGQHLFASTDFSDKMTYFDCNYRLQDDSKTINILDCMVKELLYYSNLTLINNAGVCLQGNKSINIM